MSSPSPIIYPSSLLYPAPRVAPSYALRGLIDDELIASLGFASGQYLFEGGIVSVHQGTCGWHGTRLNRHRGAVAVAKADGPFAPLVGERLRLTYYKDPTIPRSLIVTVIDEGQPLDDLSIPRSMFVRLAALWLDAVPISAEVLS